MSPMTAVKPGNSCNCKRKNNDSNRSPSPRAISVAYHDSCRATDNKDYH